VGDLCPEPLLDVGQAVLSVLGDVVEQRGLDGDRVDAEVRQDLRRGDRMGDVRLTGGALLALVRLDREVESTIDSREVGRRVVVGDRGLEGGPECLEVRPFLGAGPRRDRTSGSAPRRRLGRLRGGRS
jgi:hypothetical protein